MRMKTLKTILGIACAMLLLTPAVSSANWSISFGDDGVNPTNAAQDVIFNKLVFTNLTGGMTWAADPVTGFSQTGWTETLTGGTNTVTATGTSVSGTLFWTLNFAGNAPSGTTYLDYLVYDNNGTTPDYGIRLTLTNGQMNYTQNVGWRGLTADELKAYSTSAVPIPPTALLLGAGLFGVATLRKKVHQR